MKRQEIRRHKRKRKLRRWVLIVGVMFLIIASFGVYTAFQTYSAASESYDNLGREKSKLRKEEVSIGEDPISILLMGVEDYSTGGKNGRSDTLMVATLNPEKKSLTLLSIPRDTRVDIPGKGMEKITHAYAYGGKKLTIRTVESFLDIPIDYYAAVNFDAFKNIINVLGGITVNVPFDFHQDTLDGQMIYFNEGEMKLNGTSALAFARMRKQDPRGDIGRNERQQQVVKAIINKALSLDTITKIDDLAEEVGANVETNMKVREGIALFRLYSTFNGNNIEKLSLETYTERINGLSYQIPDQGSLNKLKEYLKRHLEIDDTEQIN